VASPFPCPGSKRGKKEEKRREERRTRKRKGQEARGRRGRREKNEKNEQLELQGEPGRRARALHHRACRPFRRGVWLRDIKMC